ncbi:MAG: hypothetical protein QXW48_04485 [Thermoplasmata archaeon]
MKKIIIFSFMLISIGLLHIFNVSAAHTVTTDIPNEEIDITFNDEYSGANIVYEYSILYQSNVLMAYYDYMEYINLESMNLIISTIDLDSIQFSLFMGYNVERTTGTFYYDFENNEFATVNLIFHYFDQSQYLITNFKTVGTYQIPPEYAIKRIIGISVQIRQNHVLYIDYDNDYISHTLSDDESIDTMTFSLVIDNWLQMFYEYYENGYNHGFTDGAKVETEDIWSRAEDYFGPIYFQKGYDEAANGFGFNNVLGFILLPFDLLNKEIAYGVTIGHIALIPIIFGLIGFLFSIKKGKK